MRKLRLKTRMMITLGLAGVLQTLIIGGIAGYYLSHSLYEETEQRALMVARTVAAAPSLVDGILRRDLDRLNQIASSLAATNNALFVVVGDEHSTRLAHPEPDRIGHSMADDDGDLGRRALVNGQSYVARAKGSLGESMRAKTPVFHPDTGRIIGIVSVGYSLAQVDATLARYNLVFYGVVGLMILGAVLSALLISDHFKKAIFGLEPEEIARRFREQEATLQSVREGIIAVNRDGMVTTANRAACATLGLPADTQLAGRHVLDILPESRLLSVLETGKPDFDQEIILNGRKLVVNRLPVRQDSTIMGVVTSFRPSDELHQVSQQLTRIQQYADTLRSQTHEYSNKLHTISGLIQIDAKEEALALIGSEVSEHQSLFKLLLQAVPDPIVAGCLLGKYNRAREMGLRLEIDLDSAMEDIPARLSREQLVSVLGNLIDNALEATRLHTGEGGCVYLSMTDLGTELIFEIEDQGPGVPEPMQGAIFRKGVSAKGYDHGIGLYLVQQFVTLWKGSVTIENLPMGGSRFTLYVPKRDEEGVSL